MRIIAGELKGRRLQVPELAGIRPTSDRARSGMFSALTSLRSLEGARILDLFAGSGALGLEALSRGAAAAVFVDEARQCTSSIAASLERFGVAEQGTVIQSSVEDFLKRSSRPGAAEEARFDVIFADPPYKFPTQDMSGALSACAAEGTLLVLETARSAPILNEDAGALECRLLKEKAYGDTLVRFYIFRKFDTSQVNSD